MYSLLISLSILTCCGDDLTVLKAQDGVEPAQFFSKWLKEKAHKALDERRERYEKVVAPDQIRDYQQRLREFFLKQLGPMPPKGPLNAEVVGRLTGDRHRVEKVIFESRPNHHITAVLYLPESMPPYPGVIIPCGHSANGKAAEAYQRASILLAQNGIAALCYDPIGQGERYQVLDREGKPEYSTTVEHTLMGVGSILLGTNTAGYRVYDGMRAIDYLQSRPDIDPKRIGCTGNSGGGTLTSYLMALDDRIQCAAPSCYLTTFGRLIDTIGPQDAEQNIFGQIAFGMDHPDYVLMRAPKPTLLCAATKDFFDISGTWDNFRQAKRFYTRMGAHEKVSLVETDAQHGFSTELRVGAVRWMRRWLLGIDDAIQESDFPIYTDEQLQCTPSGQVLLIENEKSVFDLNRELGAKYQQQRAKSWQENPATEILGKVRELLQVPKLDELTALSHREVGKVEKDGYHILKLVLQTADGRVLPALLYWPQMPKDEAVLYLHGQSKAAAAGENVSPATWVKEGKIVLAVDLSGIGETEAKDSIKAWTPLFGPDWKEVFLAYLLGKSFVGIRTEETLLCARFLKDFQATGSRQLHLVGVGEAGVPALHAAALEPGLFRSVDLRNTIKTWSELLTTPVTRDQLVNTVHGALELYDLDDLERSLKPHDVPVTRTDF